MIIKGRARGRSQQLAKHLLRIDQNETVRLFECRGTVSDEVASGLAEMEALGKAVASRRPLYHASISPEKNAPLTDEQVRIAADLLESKLGFREQPRMIVLHRKNRRDHVHVVWSRVDVEKRCTISDSWNYRRHEQAARELEELFGHRHLQGSRSQHTRRRRSIKDYELQQAERSGVPSQQVSKEISALWLASPDGAGFRKRLADAGYILARGDRRVFVVIDRAGEVHSLTRRIEVADARTVRASLAGVELSELPSVSEVRKTVHRDRKRKTFRMTYARAAREVGFRPVRREVVELSLSDEPKVTGRGMSPEAVVHYRSIRAIVVASFAARIAEAFENAPRDQLADILAALKQERSAALKAIARDERSEGRQSTREVSRKARSRRRQVSVRLARFLDRRTRRKDGKLPG
ncbi:relaxase/mobilization nuclease domain-containing protein [Rhodopseudomonas pseudopalustris]|uniref:Relaxase/Mobilisation nuclease domain-containing protein n=1 Tax=Rhodopseudomonas pseudopalustris TaxID=1513892 RepID=A0A1H8SQ99_9BRAD|nr:relaxase/mobilization nuclease domain-containing protein [Rhodopseudomonas pseudopalustris]SEO80882.1 Relaxase/Mobilisation nuclease domain-containing protein [Rhodopseudomonas pseudopalustris]